MPVTHTKNNMADTSSVEVIAGATAEEMVVFPDEAPRFCTVAV